MGQGRGDTAPTAIDGAFHQGESSERPSERPEGASGGRACEGKEIVRESKGGAREDVHVRRDQEDRNQ